MKYVVQGNFSVLSVHICRLKVSRKVENSASPCSVQLIGVQFIFEVAKCIWTNEDTASLEATFCRTCNGLSHAFALEICDTLKGDIRNDFLVLFAPSLRDHLSCKKVGLML